MKIYTRKGDLGETGLLGGTRVPKDDLRIEAYGTVDELNCFLGLLRDQPSTEPEAAFLQSIQDRLFVIGAALAVDDPSSKVYRPDLHQEDIDALETSMDAFEASLPELKSFVLPGGHPANSAAHVCRTVCRRAERLSVRLMHEWPVEPIVISYLNRLSDWFFVYARALSQRAGAAEIAWQPRAAKG